MACAAGLVVCMEMALTVMCVVLDLDHGPLSLYKTIMVSGPFARPHISKTQLNLLLPRETHYNPRNCHLDWNYSHVMANEQSLPFSFTVNILYKTFCFDLLCFDLLFCFDHIAS